MNGIRKSRPTPNGFSLVEIMVALVIGLISTIVIMQVFALSEGRKRTTTGGADAQTNSAVGLYMIERELRQAGHGLEPNPEDFSPMVAPPTGVLQTGVLALCAKVRTYNTARPGNKEYTYENNTFVPVVINPTGFPPGDDNTDVIMLTYGGSTALIGKGIPVSDSGASVAGGNVNDYVTTDSRAGLNQGDLMLTVPAKGTGLDCSIGEVTALPAVAPPTGSQCSPGVTGATNLIAHNNAAYRNYYKGCAADTATWNKTGGPGVTYNTAATYSPKVYSLGQVGKFVSRVYAIRGGNLTRCDVAALGDECTTDANTTDPKIWTPITYGIVALKAQYGKDNNFDGTIDSWDATQETDPAKISSVTMVRLVLVARNNQYEKDEVTTDSPVWHKDATGTADATLDLSASLTDWKHYRYKTVQTIVPLRNLIWGEQK